MKRSEMIEIIKYHLYGNSFNPAHLNEATALLNVIEDAGMYPPDRYNKEVDGYVSEWEPEGSKSDAI